MAAEAWATKVLLIVVAAAVRWLVVYCLSIGRRVVVRCRGMKTIDRYLH